MSAEINQLHSEARDEAFMLFSDLSELTDNSRDVLLNTDDNDEDVEARINGFSNQIHNIREVLSRQQFKVVFFGRTSSGKSTLINALLGDNVLPSGLGHTTRCFVQIQGTDESQPSLMTALGDSGCFTETPVTSLQDITDALTKHDLDDGDTHLVILNWPRASCPLLQEDVVLVDSPGVDVTSCSDSWIQQFCQDADIFILVSNSESTIMRREKRFFSTVAENISNPNIVIVHNRWDCTDQEQEDVVHQVHEQHLQRSEEFLCQELGVTSKDFLHHRMFFTSAREALEWKRNGQIEESFRAAKRRSDFMKLEQMLRHHLTSTSIHTKYGTHTVTGKNICSEIINILDDNLDKLETKESDLETDKAMLTSQIELNKIHMDSLGCDIKLVVEQLMETVSQKVSVIFHEEVNNLNIIQKNFSTNIIPKDLSFKHLENFLESSLTHSINQRINQVLKDLLQISQDRIQYKLSPYFDDAEKYHQKFDDENKIHLSVRTNSFQDFQFTAEFQFSWGIFYWLREHQDSLRKMFPGSLGEDSCHLGVLSSPSVSQSLVKMMVLVLASHNTMSGMITSGLMCRRSVVTVLGTVAASHLLLYLYERLLWSCGGQERLARSRFVSHHQSRLRLLVHSVTARVQQHIQQVLLVLQ